MKNILARDGERVFSLLASSAPHALLEPTDAEEEKKLNLRGIGVEAIESDPTMHDL